MHEEVARVKHEFLAGQVWAMAGGSPDHAAISVNVSTLLATGLRGQPCRVYSAGLRVRVLKTGLGTSPDITVVCGQVELAPEDSKGHTVTNPRVLVEVLSPSTEDYDRGEKLGHFKTIDSLAEVVIVAHDRREIEIVRREPDGSWSRHVAANDDVARVASLGIELPLHEVYANPLG